MSVQISQHGDVSVMTLNNPAKRNALTAEMARAIADAIEEATRGEYAAQRRARAILLRGEGPVFCAGADLSGGVYAEDFEASLKRMLQCVVEAPVPVIADIHGPAVGAGCQLALACDLRIFGDKGECWIPVAQHGFAMDTWTIARATELLGGAIARNLLLGGAHVTVGQALATGFAFARVEEGAGLAAADESLEVAARVAAGAPLSMEHSKRVLNSADPAADPALDALFSKVWASRDAAEARRARQQRREPEFQGR